MNKKKFIEQFLVQGNKRLDPKPYVIDDENKSVINTLADYFTGATVPNLDPTKGILLIGNPGGGKTIMMKTMRDVMLHSDHTFGWTTCRQIAQSFGVSGFKDIIKWGSGCKWHTMFDDLGAEGDMTYFGTKANVMADIIQDRYENFIDKKFKMHITTNLDWDGIRERYGVRVESRLHEMCNVLILRGSPSQKDRRHG